MWCDVLANWKIYESDNNDGNNLIMLLIVLLNFNLFSTSSVTNLPTNVGPLYKWSYLQQQKNCFAPQVVSMFRGCKTEDMPPHVYSLTQTAYRAILESRRDQSLIFLGRSASGKTTSFKHALYYLALAAGSVNKLMSAEKVNAINTIMESFGNTKTCMNSNATRFTQILSLDFDHTGQIASASLQVS